MFIKWLSKTLDITLINLVYFVGVLVIAEIFNKLFNLLPVASELNKEKDKIKLSLLFKDIGIILLQVSVLVIIYHIFRDHFIPLIGLPFSKLFNTNYNLPERTGTVLTSFAMITGSSGLVYRTRIAVNTIANDK